MQHEQQVDHGHAAAAPEVLARPSSHRRGVAWLLAASVLATAVVAAAGTRVAEAGSSAHARAVAASNAKYVARWLGSDTFGGAAGGGWGVADRGGSWSTLGPRSALEVTGGTGVIRLFPDGSVHGALLRGASSPRINLALTVGSNRVPTGSGAVVLVVGRLVQGAGQYLARLQLAHGGAVFIDLERRAASGVPSMIKAPVRVRGVRFIPSRGVRVRLETIGVHPTIVRVKVWDAAKPEPLAWQLAGQDVTPQLQATGSVGIAGYVPRRAGNVGVVLKVDNVYATTVPFPRPASALAGKGAALGAARTANHAGSVPVGSALYAIPAGAIFVAPRGSDAARGTITAPLATIARAAALARNGGTIVLRGGEYHESVMLPGGKRLIVQAYPREAVWLDGSSSVTGWVADGSAWRKDGWTASFDHSPTYSKGAADGRATGWSFIDPKYPMAAYPDQVWINGAALRQVGSRAQVVAGTFFVDTSAHRLYVGSSPVGHVVRASDLTTGITVTSAGSVLRGFGVRRYATSVPMMGTVRVFAASVTVQNLIVSDNATQGISVTKPGGVLSRVTSIRNGLDGIHGNYADGLRVIACVASGNNTEHFNNSPVSGGLKVTRTRGIAIVDSSFYSNDGPGIWLDESVYGGTITGDNSVGNKKNGIVIEISDTMLLRDNVLASNGGNGIKLDNTGHVRVVNNTFASNNRNLNITQDPRSQFRLSDAGHDPRQKLPDATVPWLSAHITVLNNVFDGSTGNALFAVEDYTHHYSAAALQITANGNVYARVAANAPSSLVIWSRGSGSPALFASVAQFRAATGQESG